MSRSVTRHPGVLASVLREMDPRERELLEWHGIVAPLDSSDGQGQRREEYLHRVGGRGYTGMGEGEGQQVEDGGGHDGEGEDEDEDVGMMSASGHAAPFGLSRDRKWAAETAPRQEEEEEEEEDQQPPEQHDVLVQQGLQALGPLDPHSLQQEQEQQQQQHACSPGEEDVIGLLPRPQLLDVPWVSTLDIFSSCFSSGTGATTTTSSTRHGPPPNGADPSMSDAFIADVFVGAGIGSGPGAMDSSTTFPPDVSPLQVAQYCKEAVRSWLRQLLMAWPAPRPLPHHLASGPEVEAEGAPPHKRPRT